MTYTWWATLDDYTGAANVSQLQFIAGSRVGRQCGRKQEGMQRKEENGVAVGVAAVVVERERVARNEGWSASSTLPPLPDENGEAPSLAKSLFPWREQEIASRRAA